MSVLTFIIGCWFGFGMAAALSTNAYEKGYEDAKRGVTRDGI